MPIGNINANELPPDVLAAITANLVLFGRGPSCYSQPGNIEFRRIIEAHVDDYLNASTQNDRTIIIDQCHAEIDDKHLITISKANNHGVWRLATRDEVRNKVAHYFRDAGAARRAVNQGDEMHDAGAAGNGELNLPIALLEIEIEDLELLMDDAA